MNQDEIESLTTVGKILIEEVFDRSCEYLQTKITRGMTGNRPDPMQQSFEALDENAKRVALRFMFDAVDQTFAQFLNFLEAHDVPLSVNVRQHGRIDISGLSDGLAVEPYGDDGWIARFSKFKGGISQLPH
ncbi:MAG: hypothetical protein JSS02_12425 [Planctomycetes bacterium]|nr:hypothetical protein [Planctomycetota bacterium]